MILEVRRDLLERLYLLPRGDSAGLDYGRVHDLMVHETERLKARTRAFHRAFERYSRGIWFVLEAMDLTRLQAAESREINRQQENMARLGTESRAWPSCSRPRVSCTWRWSRPPRSSSF